MLSLELFIPGIYTLAAIFYALLGLYAWKKRPAVAVVSFAWVMLSASFWSFTYAIEIFLPSVITKQMIVAVEYPAIISLPALIFIYALDYTGRSHLLTRRVRLLIWLVPLLTLLLVWTNPIHQWTWRNAGIYQIGPLRLLSLQFGFAFNLFIGYSLITVTLACILLIMDFLQKPGKLRIQISFVILSVIVSLVGVFAFVNDLTPIPYLDLTPLIFLPAAVGLAWTTLQYQLSQILTLEHITVLKEMKDSVIVLNDRQRILYINPITEQLLNRTEDEAIGQPFEQVAGSLAETLLPHLHGNKPRVEIQLQNQEAEIKTYQASISPTTARQNEAAGLIITLHDITLQKEKEQELSRHAAIMAAVSRAAEQFLKSSEWQDNIANVLSALGQAANVSRVYVAVNQPTEENQVLTSLKYEWAALNTPPQINNPALQQVNLNQAGFERWVNLLSQGNLLNALVKDLPSSEKALLEPLQSRSIAAAPIFVDGTWWGFLLFDECQHERQWTRMELDAFQTAASIFGAAESQTRTAKSLLRRQLAMSLVQDLVSASLQAENLPEMTSMVTRRMAELIGADGCFLTLWDETNQRTIPTAAHGTPMETYTRYKSRPGERTFTQSVIESNRTLIIENTEDTPHAAPTITSRFPSKSILALPLTTMGKKLGAVLISFEKTHHFEEEEIQVCEQAAALISLMLEKMQAVDEAKRRADTSEALRKAGLAIAEKLEMDQVIPRILDQLKRVVPYDSASVQLLDKNELVVIGGRGWENMQDVLGMRFPIPGDNPNSEVLALGKPISLSEPWQRYPAFKRPPANHIRSWVGAPLIVQGKIIGLLAIDSANPETFKNLDLRDISEFANQVAVALENVRIFEESQTQALTDPLTTLYNRRGLSQLGSYELHRSRRIHRPFSAMMFDIDHFKKVNDTHGHGVGDQVLTQLAQRCLKNSRTTDLVGRYGGEEFIILLTETNLEAARHIAERLRQSIMNTPFTTEAGNIQITSSIGVAESKIGDTLETLIERADAALYNAKNNGRNQVAFKEE